MILGVLLCEPLFPHTGVSARRLQRRLAKQDPMPRKALAAAAAVGSAGSERADSRSASPADKVGREGREVLVSALTVLDIRARYKVLPHCEPVVLVN